MNAQLFNFHAAGASNCSPSTNDSSDLEPTGSSGSIVVCKSWNRGVALHLSPSAATHTAAPPVLVCIVQQLVKTSWPKHPWEDGKRHASSASAASSSSGCKSRRA